MTNEDYKQEAECTRCKGSGKRFSKGFTADSGQVYPDRTYDCTCCHGVGKFPSVDVAAIGKLIQSKNGFRKAWPSKLSPWRSKNATERRAYYIWRLARFHGGADVTLPMTAIDTSEGDPHIKFLEAMAVYVASKVFKSSRAGTLRWQSALGHSVSVPADAPATARSGGPVVIGEKPSFEAMELL